MSKLPNAPLLEVIFELSWEVNSSKEREKFQFLLGDIYSQLKDEYPTKIALMQPPILGFEIPIEVLANKPIYRFKKNDFYPIYQIGPGLLSVNTVDAVYFWEEFELEIINILEKFQISYDFEPNSYLKIALKYIDFYEFDFNNDAFAFLKENLHLDINQNIHTLQEGNPIFVNFGAGYKNNIGVYNIIINPGVINQKGGGFIVETNIVSQTNSSELNKIPIWLKKAHSILSENFIKMTEGKMYESFKSNTSGNN